MKSRLLVFPGVLFVALFFLGVLFPLPGAAAAPEKQFVTSTPGPDGRILYTVVGGDSCSSVALKHGITVDQLRQFNPHLDPNCTLIIGQPLVVGVVSIAPTAGALPTLASPTVTATPVSGTTEVCVLLFNDENGDAMRQSTELG